MANTLHGGHDGLTSAPFGRRGRRRGASLRRSGRPGALHHPSPRHHPAAAPPAPPDSTVDHPSLMPEQRSHGDSSQPSIVRSTAESMDGREVCRERLDVAAWQREADVLSNGHIVASPVAASSHMREQGTGCKGPHLDEVQQPRLDCRGALRLQPLRLGVQVAQPREAGLQLRRQQLRACRVAGTTSQHYDSAGQQCCS